jgi:tetratricopeptide (TPR) repeat protein
METRKEKAETTLDNFSSRFTFWAVALCGLLVLARLITSFFPHIRAWGVNQLAYFPLYVRIILVVLTFSVFIPKINQWVRTRAKGILEFLWEQIPKDKRYLWYAGFSLLAMVLFWVLRSRTHFLGDGYQLISTMDKGGTFRPWAELLEAFVYLNLHKLLNLVFSADAQLTYQIGSIVAGGIFVFLLFLFSEYLGKDLWEKIFVFSILATLGSVQLFFGYVEHYSFAYLTVLAYIFLGLRYLDHQEKLLFVILAFGLCLAFHFASFYLLPSFAYLLLLDKEGRINKKRIWGLGTGLFLLAVLFLLYILWAKPGLMRIFVLPVEHWFAPGYTSFSWAHLLDLLNEHLLTSPVGLILVFIACSAGWRKSELKSSAVCFLLLVTGFQLLFHFMIDPGLGAPRDWDLFSSLSLGYTILGLRLFLNLRHSLSAFKYVATILVFCSFFSTLPWIALNASESKSIQRFRDVLDLDPKRSRSGHYFLAQYFDQKGMMGEAERENRRQKEIFPELYLIVQAMEYSDKGMPDTALALLKKANELNPFSSEVHYYLGKVHHLQGNSDSAEIEYKQALKLNPEYFDADIGLAQLYVQKQLWDKVLEQYKKVLKFRIEDPGIYNNVGTIYLYQDQLDEAIKYFRKAIALRYDLVLAHSGLAQALSKSGQVDEAITEFENAIQLRPDLADVYFYLGYLYRDKGRTEKAKTSWEQFLKLSKDPNKSEAARNALESLRNPDDRDSDKLKRRK